MVNTQNILSSEQIEAMYREMMLGGVPKGIDCGVENIDDCFRLDRGKLVVVTGIPNMGKSEFVDFLCVQYNKLYGMKTMFFSRRGSPLTSGAKNSHATSSSVISRDLPTRIQAGTK